MKNIPPTQHPDKKLINDKEITPREIAFCCSVAMGLRKGWTRRQKKNTSINKKAGAYLGQTLSLVIQKASQPAFWAPYHGFANFSHFLNEKKTASST